MLSTNYRAASALMSTRYPPVKDHELLAATKQARRANTPLHAKISVRAVTARPSRIRILLHRLGVAGS